MDIKGLLQQIEATQKIANRFVEDYHSAVRSAHETAIREAKDKLIVLTKEYADFCKKNCMGVFLYGEPKRIELFTDLVKDGGNVIVVNSSYPWNEWAAKIEPTFGNYREFSVTQIRLLSMEVKELTEKLRLPFQEISQPSIPFIKDQAELVRYIYGIIRNSYQDRLYQEVVTAKVVDLAIRRMIATAPMVLVTNLDEGQLEKEAALSPMFVNGHISLNLDDAAKEFAAKDINDDNAKEAAIKLLTETKKKIRSLRQPDKTK